MRKRKGAARAGILMLAAAFAGISAAGIKLPDAVRAAAEETERPGDVRVPVWVYMQDNCGGCSADDWTCNVCTGENQYRQELLDILTEEGLYGQVDFRMYNIFFSVNRTNLLNLMEVEEEPADMIYPAAFVGGTMLMGEDEIGAKLADTVRSEAAGGDAREWRQAEPEIGSKTVPEMVYFTMEGCGDCERLSAWLDEKDEELSGQIYRDMYLYEVGDDIPGSWEMLEKTYILYGREQESLWVPTILAGGQCLIGEDEIKDYFGDYRPGEDHGAKVPKDFE